MLVNQYSTKMLQTQSFAARPGAEHIHSLQKPSTNCRLVHSATFANLRPQHIVAATTEMHSPAAPQMPSSWHEPLSTILWQVQHGSAHIAIFKGSCAAMMTLLMHDVQGSESEARKQLPLNMAPPWKVSGHDNAIF